jgi:hypothetical protein
VASTRYDQQALGVRRETTGTDGSCLRPHRQVAHSEGTTAPKLAPLQQTISALAPLRARRGAATRR